MATGNLGTWLRRNFAWSNSPQSWTERGVGLAVFALVVALVLAGARLPAAAQVALWLVLLLVTAALLRRGWLKLFGPVLFYDMIRTARRGRYLLVRCLYAAFLFATLLTVYLNSRVFHRDAWNYHEASTFAESFFTTLTIVQVLVAALLTPAYVAGAISEEKTRKTLEFLLATDLRSREIVLSIYCSRIANLGLLMLVGLPFLSFLQFLGGIDPNLVLLSYGILLLTIAGVGSLAILHSVLIYRPRDAIALTYLFLVVYTVVATMLFQLQSGNGFAALLGLVGVDAASGVGALIVGVLSTVSEAVNLGNPIAILNRLSAAGMSGTVSGVVAPLFAQFASFQAVVIAICLGISVWKLRPIALRQTVGKTVRAREFRRPEIGQMPMIWKEVFVEGQTRMSWLSLILFVVLILLTLGSGAAICLFHNSNAWQRLSSEMNVWVRFAGTGVACLLLLAVAVRASGTISSERDRDTLDALLTTPLRSNEILFAKFLGSLLSVRHGLLWWLSILLLAMATGGLHPFALPLVLTQWLLFASGFAMLGIWYSMVCRTSMQATVATVLTTLFLGGGQLMVWMCCAGLLVFSGGGNGEVYLLMLQMHAGLTPISALVVSLFEADNIHDRHTGPDSYMQVLLCCIVAVFIWGMGVLVYWSQVLGPRFRRYTRRHRPGFEETPERS